MYACMHAYVRASMHACSDIHRHVPVQSSIHPSLRPYKHTCIRTYLLTHMHSCMHTCTHAHLQVHIHVHTCTCKPYLIHSFVCMYIPVRAYWHTYIRTYVQRDGQTDIITQLHTYTTSNSRMYYKDMYSAALYSTGLTSIRQSHVCIHIHAN